jgi:hypothetical protein
MGDLGKMLDFDLFTGKDIFNKIFDDPKRLLLGVDPLSTKMWNGILGRDDEPIVDQLGGPYGGHTISAFGKNEGGTYGRAREAGLDTGPSETGHDIAHVISAMYAGNGIFGQNFGNYVQQGNSLVQGQQQPAAPPVPVYYPPTADTIKQTPEGPPTGQKSEEIGKALTPPQPQQQQPDMAKLYAYLEQVLKGA